MPRAFSVVVVGLVLALLTACSSGSSSRPRTAGGPNRSETTTSATTPASTATSEATQSTRTSAGAVSELSLAADCLPASANDLADAAAVGRELHMVSAQKGFAVDDTTIVVTDDGRMWSRRYSGADKMVSVDAADADHAWAVGQQVILATSDGGRTWRPVGEPAQGSLRAVDFIDAKTGWGVTATHVFRSDDGGTTWRGVDPPCGGESVCFAGPDDGWAGAGPRVYRSTDGGGSWQLAFTVPTDGVDSPFRAESVHAGQMACARSGVVWVYFTAAGSGSHVGYAAYRGTATGQWTPVLKEPEAGPRTVQAPAGGSNPAPMCGLGADSALFVMYTPLGTPANRLGLREATGGGRSLGPARPITGIFSALAISFVSPQLGWVIGAKPGSSAVDAILATADGGQTWQEQYAYTIPLPAG